ncbi:MAG: prolipoprotein diacylglyceryl transferase [Magnetococcales bacterium]|nr:prolipoprotein diacylglyceryl transferase [Magnetococcales bacterium]
MIAYPSLDPIIIQIGPLAVRWYGLMYLLSFLLGWVLLRRRARRWMPALSVDDLSDLLLWIVLGVIVGGRLGYVLFYNSSYYWSHPQAMLHLWEGGMSFHGGLIGVLLTGWWFARRHKIHFLALADLVIPIVPLGLFFGRIGNFINGELWGRATDLPWGMIFPGAGDQPRHPSQLYEAVLEGVVLFVLLWWSGRRPRPRGWLLGLFLMGYALSRFLVEFVREPDSHLGYLAWGWTMGQWLTLPMVVAAIFLLRPERRSLPS